MQATLDELQCTLEELQVASEELLMQNENLLAAQVRLSIEQDRYREHFHSAPSPYLVTDPNGIIQEGNFAAAKLLGIEQWELRIRPLSNSIAPYDCQRFRAYLAGLKKGSCSPLLSADIQPKMSGIVTVEITASAIWDAHNLVEGIRWLMRDLTTTPEAERERTLRIVELSARQEAERSLAQLMEIFETSSTRFFVSTRQAVAEQSTQNFGTIYAEINSWLYAAIYPVHDGVAVCLSRHNARSD